MSLLRPCLVITASLTLLTGLAYPLLITGAGQALFPRQARGSLLLHDGQVAGSSLIGQHTEDPRYFWGRLSATDYPTDALASGGSNQSAAHPGLRATAAGRIQALRDAAPGDTRPVPVDLVTASGSGLDPEISPAAADFQVGRVARLRGLPEPAVRALVSQATRGRVLGLFGEPRVNVLQLNLSLESHRP
jgi:K+-transporting ATPase ATPase C chain